MKACCMKAVVIPHVHGAWTVSQVAIPEPKHDEVLIKLHASGICYSDVHLTQGSLPGKFPQILGHEPAGEIVAVGAAVTSRTVGDRVGLAWNQRSCGRCEWCLGGRPRFCLHGISTGIEVAGSHAEYMSAPADATMLIPDALSYEQAAPIFCAGYTVWGGLQYADPKPHERVAVVGIGGLGHLAVQYAKAAGFETIAVTHSPDKRALATQLGADAVVESGAELAALGGADIILGTGNSHQAMVDAIAGLRPEGRLVWMGVAEDPFVVPARLFEQRGRIVASGQNGAQYLYEALDLAARGKVRVMEECFPIDQAAEAYERVATGKARFRAVLVM